MSLRFDQTKFDELYKWFNRNIKRISSVFKINLFGLKKFLSKLNRMLRSWGFATVKKGRLRKVIIRCPIRSNPKGRKNMVRFYQTIIEHSEYISVSRWSQLVQKQIVRRVDADRKSFEVINRETIHGQPILTNDEMRDFLKIWLILERRIISRRNTTSRITTTQ